MKKTVVTILSVLALPLFATSVVRNDVARETTDFWDTEDRIGTVVDECASTASAALSTMPMGTSAESENALSALDCVAWTYAESPAGNLNSEKRPSFLIMIR